MQQLPYPRDGQHLWAVPGGALHRPHRHSGPDDGAALLPYARAGAPCNGGGGIAHRLQKCRGRAGSARRPVRDPQPGHGGAGRRLRFLGRLRSRDQRRAVCGHRHPVHPFGPGALGSEQPNDRPGTGVHRPGRRPPLLQTGQLAVHSGRRRLCPGTAGRRDDPQRPPLRVQRPEQPMHRQPVPLFSRCAPAPGRLSLRTQLLPQPDGRGPGPAAGPGCI